MATFTSSGWAQGATVNAFARDAFDSQTGAAVANSPQTANAAGQVTFTGLADSTKYVATDGSRAVRFRTPDPVSTGGGVAAPTRTRKILGAIDGQTSVNGSSWSEQHAALWLPRGARPLPKRKASNITRCDTLTGVTGTLGRVALDATRPGLGAAGSLRLSGSATPVSTWNMTIPLTGAPWSFGDGATPTAYFRIWLSVDDPRDPALSCITEVRVELGTAAGFTNDIWTDMGSAVSGDGNNIRPRSRNVFVPSVMPMIDKDDADMWQPPASGQSIWSETGTGFAAADWAAVTQVKISLTTKSPASGTYAAPAVNVGGIERVPLPPYALLSFQSDWPMPDHDGIWGELNAAYGVVPLCLCYPSLFRGTQGSTEMTLTQYLSMIERRGFDSGIYAVQQINLPRMNETGLPTSVQVNGMTSPNADGSNNFGGGTATIPGVPWSNYPMSAVEQDIAETQAYFAEYNLSGWDLLMGQERKLRDDELAQGGALHRKYASFGHSPQASEFVGYWPPDNPYRVATYMLDPSVGGRDFVDGVTLTANAQARIRRAVKNKEWLRILVHEAHPTYPTSTGTGVSLSQLRALLDYATAAGRFDGTAGKIVSQTEAMNLSRTAT